MEPIKEEIEAIIRQISSGSIPATESWSYVQNLKDRYVQEINEQSWHAFIGNKFQQLVHAILTGHIKSLQAASQEYQGLAVLKESELKRNSVLVRKLAVQYGDFLLLPDADSVIAWIDAKDRWKSEILAIVSCKTSLRERIAQACYWKLKLLSSDVTKNVRVFLATADNDGDFSIKETRGRYNGLHRNRIISEYELDGIYILNPDFRNTWESERVKVFWKLLDDIVALMTNRPRL